MKQKSFRLLLTILFLGFSVTATATEIYPSGDVGGLTDQASIQAALDAAGPNEKAEITLAAGTFF
jgi:hypothetical protein